MDSEEKTNDSENKNHKNGADTNKTQEVKRRVREFFEFFGRR